MKTITNAIKNRDWDQFEVLAKYLIEKSNTIAYLPEDHAGYDGREEIQLDLVKFWSDRVGFPEGEPSETLSAYQRNI